MAIQSASNIANPSALLSAFVSFCVANAGFTDEGTDTVGGETLYKISRTTSSLTTYWGFVYAPQSSGLEPDEIINCRMMHVEPTAANWNTLADGQRNKTRWSLNDNAGPYTGYTFYSDGVNCFAILEIAANIFTHMCIGNITKCDTFTGGEFLQTSFIVKSEFISGRFDGFFSGRSGLPFSTHASTNNSNYVRYNTGNNDQRDYFKMGNRDNTDNVPGCGTMVPGNDSSPPNYGSSDGSLAVDIFGDINVSAPTVATLRSPITPCYVLRRDNALDRARIIGEVPNIGSIDISQLNPKDLVNTDWRIYPWAQKNAPDTTVAPDSGMYGVAYKEIP